MPTLTFEDIQALCTRMRPRLHRYCARMVGSSIDGEDVVQDAMVKALGAGGGAQALDNPEGWLLRIAHNAAVDLLRRRRREPLAEEEPSQIMAASANDDHEVVVTSLRTFLRLPALQRSAVILKDVLGHSLVEIASIIGVSEPAAKSALQRGRVQLRALAREPEQIVLPALSGPLRGRLTAYVEGFRSGDFDAVRAMLAEEVQLDLVGRFRGSGKRGVSEYFNRYAAAEQWAYAAGVVEGRPAMLVYDRSVSLATPTAFVALSFEGGRVTAIRDFLYAREAMEGVELQVLSAPSQQRARLA